MTYQIPANLPRRYRAFARHLRENCGSSDVVKHFGNLDELEVALAVREAKIRARQTCPICREALKNFK